MSRSAGHCMVMGTASTMASVVESLGLGLPYNAALPAVDSRRRALAHLAGRRIVAMIREDVRISKILTRAAFENAIRVNGAIGGSTNAVIHLLAIAGRVGVPLTLEDWDDLRPRRADAGRPQTVGPVPDGGLPLRGRPAGRDSHARRGRPAQPRRADGQRQDDLGELQRRAAAGTPKSSGRSTSRSPRSGGIAVLRGNLAPDGAVLKPSAASPHLMRHRGRAVVFDTIEHYKARSTTRRWTSTQLACWCCKNSGPSRLSRNGRRSATWACRRQS